MRDLLLLLTLLFIGSLCCCSVGAINNPPGARIGEDPPSGVGNIPETGANQNNPGSNLANGGDVLGSWNGTPLTRQDISNRVVAAGWNGEWQWIQKQRSDGVLVNVLIVGPYADRPAIQAQFPGGQWWVVYTMPEAPEVECGAIPERVSTKASKILRLELYERTHELPLPGPTCAP